MTVIERIGDRISRSDFSSKMHGLVYRVSGGRVGSRVKGIPVLLLTTTGRRSGQDRTVPLMYLPDAERMLVVASNAAEPDNPPGWWFNLSASPRAAVRVEGEAFGVDARIMDEAERREWWPRLVAHNPNWGRYQSETDRPCSVVVLTPSP
jgi:deazaflavin-dependent oxidoreductase (nitroreductase family)